MPREVEHSGSTRLRPGPTRTALSVLAILGLALSAGCSRKFSRDLVPDQRPTMRLTYAPVDTTQREFYVYRMYWTGFDADGRVVRYEYAVDPPGDAGADTEWAATTLNSQTITFSATQPESLGIARPLSRDFHVFVIRAVDNRGLYSEPVARAFYSFCVAPVVRIESPAPSSLIFPLVPPNLSIRWTGMDFTDPTGATFEKPLYYKYKLFKRDSDPRWAWWLSHPDSMRATFAPAFAGWDSTGPDSSYVRYTGLVPNSEYLFVVVAFGRSGAYSPVWNLNTNMLCMSVGFAWPLSPQITLYNSFFSYTYATGGFPSPLDPSWAIPLQAPAGMPLTFNWYAVPSAGSELWGYRWVMDPVSLEDETERSGPGDWSHWSDWSLATTRATVGPFAGGGGDSGEVHDFFVEAKDVNGLVSLGWVRISVFRMTRERDLLIVDDTRLRVDQLSRTQPPGRTDSLAAPAGNWPTRAELDTFLFAVGGVPWRMTPWLTLSQPGLFHGYSYDTMSTRHGQENPTTPLNVLGQYRHIVWMVDQTGSYYGSSPVSTISPMTTLNYMSKRNRQNALATWVSLGGDLWALGGGFGNATNTSWNSTANDLDGVRTYSSLPDVHYPTADLVPGRFMYDLAHWRSEFRVFEGFIRFARLDQPDPTSTLPAAWKGKTLSDPRYSVLPAQLLPRSPATDPLWPYRPGPQYYLNNPTYSSTGIGVEYLTYRNSITETIPVTPDSSYVSPALDTLYMAYSPAYTREMLQAGQGVNVMMTRYRGSENGSVVFQGTSIWDYRREHCQALVDFVLGQIWGLPKSAAVTPAGRQTASRR
jgi:hypothetical protein